MLNIENFDLRRLDTNRNHALLLIPIVLFSNLLQFLGKNILKTDLRKSFAIQTITIPALARFAYTVVFKTGFIDDVSIERISNKIGMKYFLAKISSLKVVKMTLNISK